MYSSVMTSHGLYLTAVLAPYSEVIGAVVAATGATTDSDGCGILHEVQGGIRTYRIACAFVALDESIATYSVVLEVAACWQRRID